MIRRALCLVTVCVSLCLLAVDVRAQSFLDRKMDGHVGYNSGLAGDVPQGLDRPYLSVCVDNDWQQRPDQVRVVQWFSQHPRLAALRAKTHFNLYRRGDPHFAQVLAPTVGTAFPIVLLQCGGLPNTPPLGKVAANITRSSMPTSPDVLADYLETAANRMQPAPQFDGQRTFTPVLDDPTAGPCPPNEPCPVDVPDQPPRVPEVLPGPSPLSSGSVPITLGLLGATAGALYLINRRPPAVALSPLR